MTVNHRVCVIEMRDEENEFGFLLEKTQHPYRICFVEKNSAAERGGLCVNDCILQINNENVTFLSFNQLIEKIKSSGKKINLVVTNRDSMVKEKLKRFDAKADDCTSYCLRDSKCIGFRKQKSSTEENPNVRREQNIDVDERISQRTHIEAADGYEDSVRNLDLIKLSQKDNENAVLNEEIQLDVRLCILRVLSNNTSYGFNLGFLNTGEHIIETVDPDSPAFHAGLKCGDRLIEVDGFNIEKATHAQVVERIKTVFEICRQAPLKLLTVDEETYTWCKLHRIQMNLRTLRSHIRIIEPSSAHLNSTNFSLKRSFRLRRRKGFLNDLGFDFITNTDGEHIVKSIQAGSPVHAVGLKVNDRILEVNNYNVKSYSHYRLRNLLNNLEADRLTMVVASEKNYRLMERKFPVSTMKLFNFEGTDSDNIGIEFLSRKIFSSYKHKIINIEPNSAADEVGLSIGDCLLEVNGNDLTNFSGPEVRDMLNRMFKRKCLKILASGRSMICNSSYYIEPLCEKTNDKEVKIIAIKIFPRGNLGFEIEYTDTYPRITAVRCDSDAYLKGIRSGDLLISLGNIDLNEADEQFIKRILNDSSGTIRAVIIDSKSDLLSQDFSYISSNQSNIAKQKSRDEEFQTVETKTKSKSLLDLSRIEVRKEDDEIVQKQKVKIFTLQGRKNEGFGAEVVSKRDGTISFENIQPNSIAQMSGLRNGDIIVEIDGINVNKFSNHNEIIERFRQSCAKNSPIIVGVKTSPLNAMRKFQSIPNLNSQLHIERFPTDPVPRCCTLRLRDDRDWGFEIRPAKGTDCPMVYSVTPGSASHRGGIAMFDMILAFDRLSVQNYDSNWPSFYIKHALHRRQMEVLVLTETAYWIYKKRGGVLRREDMNIFDYEQPLSECFTKYRPRLCVFKGKCMKKSLGFAIFKHKPNIIASVDKHSPSSKAKLKKDDIIIEINDISLTSYPDVSISSLICHFKKRGILKMLVVDQASFDWYYNRCIPLNSYLTFLSMHVVEK